MSFYEKVAALCDSRCVAITKVATDLGFSTSTPNNWKKMKRKPHPDTIKAIAEYFSVPVSYLTDENTTEIQTVNDNHGIIGNANAPVTIVNSTVGALSEQETELLNAFRKLTVMQQAQILVKTAELLEG